METWEFLQIAAFITLETFLLVQLSTYSLRRTSYLGVFSITMIGSFLQILQRMVFYNIGIPSLALSLLIDFLVIGLGFRGRFVKKLFVIMVFYAFSIIFDAASNIVIFSISVVFRGQHASTEVSNLLMTLFSKFMLMITILLIKDTLKSVTRLSAWLKYLPLPVLTLLSLLWGSPFTREINNPELFGLLAIICTFGMLANLYFIISIRRTNEKVELAYHLKILEENKKLDREHYATLHESYQKIERVAHDISHHLNYIASINSIDKVHQYVEALKERSFSQISRFTGNFDIDVVLNSKMNTMQNADIMLNTRGILPHHIEWLDSIDVSIIIGNALSNAIESCIRCDGHTITTAFKYNEEWLLITIENPSPDLPAPKKKGHGFLSSKKGLHHGIGMKSMAESIERYDGTMKYGSKNGVFRLDILLQTRGEIE